MAHKNIYIQPEIITVEIDTTITLQMASDLNPMEEPEDWVMNQDANTNNPLQA